jgi:hypothetical protein
MESGSERKLPSAAIVTIFVLVMDEVSLVLMKV